MNSQKRKIGILIIVILSIIGIIAPIAIAYINRPKCAKENEDCDTSKKGCCPDAPICNPDTKKCSVKPSEKYTLTAGVCDTDSLDQVDSLTGDVPYTDANQLINDAGLKCDADGDCAGFLTYNNSAFKCSKPIKILTTTPSTMKDSKTYINKKADPGTPPAPEDTNVYYSSIYGTYGGDSCEDNDDELFDDVRKGGGGETIGLCGVKSDSTKGISQLKVFKDDCGTGYDSVTLNKGGTEYIDLKKGASGSTWRLCYQTSTPGAKNIKLQTDTCDNAISIGDKDSKDLMNELKGQYVYACPSV